MKSIKNILMSVSLILSLNACGTKVGTGAVNVEFTNNTAGARTAEMERVGIQGLWNDLSLQASALLGVTPTIFKMKLVAFYITEAIDANTGNNVGAGAHIWISKNCDSDLTYCGINPSTANGYLADYFDFARSSSLVNADFNSYKRDTKDSQIGPGTYNYIRMDFTGKHTDTDTTPNLKFGTTTENEVRAQNYALTVKLAEPLVIAEGESFTVNLGYSLDNRFYDSGTPNSAPAEVGTQKWTCNGTTAPAPCIVEAEFSPTVTKK